MTVARATGRVRAAAIQRVFLGLLVANLAVVGAKVVIGVTAESLSVLGDGMHSSVDALNNVLVDEVAREPDLIRTAAEAVPGVQSAYHIRSRASSGVVFAELTIGVAGGLPVEQAHAIADAVEQRLRNDLRMDEVVVHIEPC